MFDFSLIKTIFSPQPQLQRGAGEFTDGRWMVCAEHPGLSEDVIAEIKARSFGEIIAPSDFGKGPITRVHTPRFVAFFEDAWPAWQALGRSGNMLPSVWSGRGMRTDRDSGYRLSPRQRHAIHFLSLQRRICRVAACRSGGGISVFSWLRGRN